MPPISSGTRLGHYEVLSQLGAGGMGEVYLAYDSTLDRKVALKILPAEVASRSDRMRRFVQEAKAAAALNHPNIAHVYEIGEHDGHHFIAMEFIDGATLSSKIHHEKTPLAKLLKYLQHVAESLAKAHAAGIVHRDLKPDNIMVSKDDHVKVLDFGLAKLTKQEPVTITPEAETQQLMTTPGAVMGTVGYMSPEQAQGKVDEIDARSDTFSFGCILFEAATGHRPFEAESVIKSLHKLVYEPAPSLSEFNVEAPPELQRIVRRCLEKDPEDRYQSVKDVAIELRELRRELDNFHTTTRSSKRLFAAALVAILILGGAGVLYIFTRQRPLSRRSQFRVVPFTSFQGREDQAALSPDGNQIAFVWDGDKGGNVDIYVKSLSSDTPLRLTSNPALDVCPAWSPDGQKIAFVRIVPSAKSTVFLTSALGTSAERMLLDLKTAPESLSWSPDGKLIATSDSPSNQRAILVFSPETGERRYLTVPPPQSGGDANPVFSRDSKSIAFIRNNTPNTGDIYVIPTTGGEPRRITSDNAEFFFGNGIVGGLAWTTDSQELVFSSSRGGIPALWRVAVSGGEPERLAIGGDDTYYPSISSKGDRLTYTKLSGGTTVYQLEIHSSLNETGPITKLFSSSRTDENVEYSPDGEKIAFNSDRSGNSEIWIADKDGTHLTQLTSFGKGKAGTPRWSPDGRFVAFDYRAADTSDVYLANVAGGAPRCITSETKDDSVPSWSHDGNFIYLQSNRGGDLQIWRVPVAGGPGVQLTRQGGLYSIESPDGRYLYFNNPTYSTQTRSSGVWRVTVAGGEAELVLDKGNAGTWGQWTMAGENIYFISVAPDGSPFLNVFNIASRRITQLTALSPGSEITSIGVSRDQRSLIFTQQNPVSSDIMLVENFR